MKFKARIKKGRAAQQSSDESSGSSDDEGQIQAGNLKKGTVIVIDGEEMEVAGIAMAKTGKHGSAKAMLMVRDPKTGKMVEKMVPSTASFKQPK